MRFIQQVVGVVFLNCFIKLYCQFSFQTRVYITSIFHRTFFISVVKCWVNRVPSPKRMVMVIVLKHP